MEIRPLSMKDYTSVITLWKQVGFDLGRADDQANIQRFLKRNPGLSLVLVDQNKIVGTIMGSDDGRRGYIYRLAVDPTCQRQGLGKKLADALLERFQKRGVQKIHGFVHEDNKVQAGFYESIGAVIRDDIFVMSLDVDAARKKS
jgi:N-acetylglutamate synthase